MRIGVLIVAVLLLALPAPAAAYDRVVNPFQSCSLSGTPEYKTMQGAVNAASPGEQIGVCPGTYDQVVSINKSVTLTAIGYVLIEPVTTPGPSCFAIYADNVTVRYFVIRGCETAISSVASGALIQNNQLQSNGVGIELGGLLAGGPNGPTINNHGGGNNIVQNNLVQGSKYGIVVDSPNIGTIIKNNTLQRNGEGIVLVYTQGVIVNKNSVQAGGIGIFAGKVADTTISYNSVSFNETGIELDALGPGNQIIRNVVTRSAVIDCLWTGGVQPVFSKNTCGTEVPAGAWD